MIWDRHICMTVKIRLLWLGMAKCGKAVFFCNHLLAIRIICDKLFLMRKTSVTKRKMWSCLLRDQDRQEVGNAVLLPHRISSRIRTDCKLPHRKGQMLEQKILLNIGFILLLCSKIGTHIFFDRTILNLQRQVLIFEFVQIYLGHMKCSMRSLQLR